MSNQVKNLPDLTRRARNNLNPADLPVTRLIYPIVYVALKKAGSEVQLEEIIYFPKFLILDPRCFFCRNKAKNIHLRRPICCSITIAIIKVSSKRCFLPRLELNHRSGWRNLSRGHKELSHIIDK
jgi:hypothetical protein